MVTFPAKEGCCLLKSTFEYPTQNDLDVAYASAYNPTLNSDGEVKDDQTEI
jgi:hypothetical protein